MQITLPFVAFASLSSMSYVHHAEKENYVQPADYMLNGDELNYLIPPAPAPVTPEPAYDIDVSV